MWQQGILDQWFPKLINDQDLPGFFLTRQIPRVQPQSHSVTSVAGSGHPFFRKPLPLSSQQLGLVTSRSPVNAEMGFCRDDFFYRTHSFFVNNNCSMSRMIVLC